MKTKIAAMVVLALLVMAAVPAVSAGPLEEEREKYVKAKEKYLDIVAELANARADFVKSRDKWLGEKNKPNLEALLKEYKRFLIKSAEVMISYTEQVRVQVEVNHGLSDNQKASLLSELDSYISELKERQSNIQRADNEQELRAAAMDLYNYWLQIRVRLKQITALLIVESAAASVQRIEAFAGTIEARIQQLKDNGINTASLENWLADLRSWIEQAEQRIDDARSKIPQITDNVTFLEIFKAAMVRVKEAIDYLRNALNRLKEIIAQMKTQKQPVTVSGSGSLMANGNGRAVVEGTGVVEIRAPIEGSLVVSSNAKVTTLGVGTKNDLGNGTVQYKGYSGARVVGTNITVDISGNGINIFASGRGTAKLTGNGLYSVQGENYYASGTWNEKGVTVKLETGQAG